MPSYELPVPGPPDATCSGIANLEAAMRGFLSDSTPWLDDAHGHITRHRISFPEMYTRLSDPLSYCLGPAIRQPTGLNRSTSEHRAREALLRSFGPIRPVSADRLTTLIFQTQIALESPCAGFRDRPSTSVPDDAGYFVDFEDPQAFGNHLESISQNLEVLLLDSAAAAATYAMVAIVALHPAWDGNGRLSRTIFNLILAEQYGWRGYLPIYELGSHSDGGWILALRRVQHEGDWSHMFRYLTCAAEIAHSINYSFKEVA